ncbi:hypothetical protein [Sporosarcina koreensis]|uniref:hypothetical protein n=1 Tax=Sporosarcina koreensis TaxID=334735 RepID=UPI0007557D32|nr:hypothetical protein [Sporosarcina koreensis]
MAEITDEIMALRHYVADIGFTAFHLGNMPTEYVAGELAIRFIGGDTASETGYHFRLNREFQFLVFGTSERDCYSKSSALQRRLNSAHKINVGESGWLTLGSFSLSPAFKAEGSEVYGIIGILQATAREARHFEKAPKIGGITIDIKPENGNSTEIKVGNGACN